jgi:hypothetical protein
MPDPAEHWFQVSRTGVANAAVSVGIAATDTDLKQAADLFDWAHSLGHPDAKMLLGQVVLARASRRLPWNRRRRTGAARDLGPH